MTETQTILDIKELRVGNCLIKWGKHYQIHEGDFYDEIGGEGYFSRGDYHPIPLTPEILEKAGFKKNSDGEYSLQDSFDDGYRKEHYVGFDSTDGKPFFCVVNLGHDGWYAIDVLYLHQLQNLYFSLTGEELNIQL